MKSNIFTLDAEIEDLKVTEKESDGKDQVYLLDYGLACKYLFSNGEHKPFCVDERKAHAGTILFCSRDAHKGVASRRSDLESLGYNIIYWLTGKLPWMKDSDDPEIVDKKKQRALADPDNFLRLCFKHYPKFLLDYFKYLQTLQFQVGFCRFSWEISGANQVCNRKELVSKQIIFMVLKINKNYLGQA